MTNTTPLALRVGSLFDGVGGGILAAEAAGMHVVWRAEIDKWCNEVMAVRRPEIMNLGSVEDIDGRSAPAVDLLIGGFPCQNLSVAGSRAGLAGKQSGLWYEFERLIGEIRPRWFVIENVPGLRSSQQGRDLGIILGALEQFGYGWAMRSLDAQYAGLAQRRERVFIVGYSGAEWAAPAQVLFEPEGVLRDSPPSREARQEVAGTLGGGSGQRGWSIDLDRMTFVPCYWDGGQVSDTLDVSSAGDIAHTLRPEGGGQIAIALIQNATRGKDQNGLGISDSDSPMYTLDGASQHAVALIAPLDERAATSKANKSKVEVNAVAPTIKERGLMSIIEWAREHLAVRRLTPLECERLQGYPDGWTAVTMSNGKPMSDSQRYRQLGNGFPVPVVTWIMKRIAAYESGEL